MISPHFIACTNSTKKEMRWNMWCLHSILLLHVLVQQRTPAWMYQPLYGLTYNLLITIFYHITISIIQEYLACIKDRLPFVVQLLLYPLMCIHSGIIVLYTASSLGHLCARVIILFLYQPLTPIPIMLYRLL